MNVPQLRFEGFSGDLKEMKLKEVATVLSGKRLPKGHSFKSSGIPYISVSDMGELYVKKEKFSYISTETEELIKKYKVNSGDIIISIAGTLGKVNLIDKSLENANLTENCNKITVKESEDNLFIFYYLKSEIVQKKIQESSTTSSQPKLALDRLRNFKILMPPLEEQQKITSFFLLLNKKMYRQQEKVEKLQQIKKGMMQKVFSQELRFKDEDGGEFPEWEETTFGEVSISMQYGMNAAAKEFDGENKYIRITDIDEGSRRYIEDGKVSPLGKLTEEYRIKKGDILFARTGASTGKSYLYRESDGKIYYAGFLIRLRVKEGVDSRFVYYQTLLKEYDQWVKVMSMRSGQPGINAQEYSSYEFSLPNIDEQIRIADFLDGIDNKIEKEREKLMVLEEQKKGFMQGMFV